MAPFVTIFGHRLSSYGVAAVAGFLLGLLFIVAGRKKYPETWKDSLDAFLLGAIGALPGAKLLYLVSVLPQLIGDIPLIRNDFAYFYTHYLAGGMVFYGGLFAAILVARLVAAFFGKQLKELYPQLIPALTLMAGMGRVGCFLAGCCYGKETAGPVYVVFTQSLFAPRGVHLIPTQLIEAGFEFVLFFVFFKLGKTKWKTKLLSIYLALYAAFRFILEFFRGDEGRGIILGLSFSQWISLAVLSGVLIHTLIVRKRNGGAVVSS